MQSPRVTATRLTAPLLIAAAMFTAAGGFVHLREWSDMYRQLPSSLPGVFMVQGGFIANAVISFVAAGALLFCAIKKNRLSPLVIAGTAAFQVASLITLIATRTSSVFGWSEHIWTLGANETRAVEIGTLLVLALIPLVVNVQRRSLALVPVRATRAV